MNYFMLPCTCTRRYIPKKVIEHDDVLREVHHKVLLGGDQMTAARTRGSKIIRMNSSNDSKLLSTLVPVAEDWHTKVVLLEVYHKYNTYMLLYFIDNMEAIIQHCFNNRPWNATTNKKSH